MGQEIPNEFLDIIDPMRDLEKLTACIYNFTESHRQHVTTEELGQLGALFMLAHNTIGLIYLKSGRDRLREAGLEKGAIRMVSIDPSEVVDKWNPGDNGYNWNPILEVSPLWRPNKEELN